MNKNIEIPGIGQLIAGSNLAFIIREGGDLWVLHLTDETAVWRITELPFQLISLR